MSLFLKLRSYYDLVLFNLGRTKNQAQHDYLIYKIIKNNIDNHIANSINNFNILDIGCGQRYPNVLLFSSFNNHVEGIDLEILGKRFNVSKYRNILKYNGFEKLFKVFFRELLFDNIYFKELEKLNGKIFNNNFNLKYANAENLPYTDDRFDIIISNAAFEHIPNVSKAVSEIKRVLKKGGLCHIEIHLFPSLSGGHNLRWAFPDKNPPKDIPPWDHLRQNKYPTHVYLNKLREKEYRNIFEKQLTILDWITEYTEGEKFITPEIATELNQYSREELLKRSVIVIARKD